MQRLNLWYASAGDEPRRVECDPPVWVCPTGIRQAAFDERQPAAAPFGALVHAVDHASSAAREAVAVIVVPEAFTSPIRLNSSIRRNGARLGAGVHILKHADCLECGGQRLWAARDEAAAEVPYDPAIQGENIFCARTKARLKAQVDLVVICPGLSCGTMYRADAWRLQLPCHVCNFDPRGAAWQPPRMKQRTLDGLLHLITATAR